MLFNSFVFLIFFAVVLGLMALLPPRARRGMLLVASYVFYGWWDWRFLGLMALSTTLDWALGMALGRRRSRALVTISVVANLGILGVFKYLGFFTRELQALLTHLGAGVQLPVLDVILPVGLSFYTFQSMAYTIDVYRGRVTPTRSLTDFALFVSFFPQLVAGPIERYQDLKPQLDHLPGATAAQRAEGLSLIVWGFFKKIVVADNLAVVVAQVFEAKGELSALRVILGAWAFTWQIYCDFSGYSDIARGVARWLGVELMINFRLPLFASSPRDLWRRWHISLSQWLRDYLYVPLGGSRGSALATQRNLLLTMLLGGLWHGANWTYIAWGAWHGAALAVQRALPGGEALAPARGWARLVAIGLTFQFTCLGFLIFRAHDLGHVGALLGQVVSGPWSVAADGAALRAFVAAVAAPLVIEGIMFWRGDDLALLTRLPWPAQALLYAALILAITTLGGTYGQQFIYFQF